MSAAFTLTIDGAAVSAHPGQTVMQAADAAGIYIPRLCAHKDLVPYGACRICTVLVNGRPQSACTLPTAAGQVVEADTPDLRRHRACLVEMLLVEGNHYCMFCEKSGNCELQALGYRLGVIAPRYPYLFPERPVDATHPEVMIDHNRCVLCGRCVRASRDLDHRHLFQFIGRGHLRRLGVSAAAGLGGTALAAADRAPDVCPGGALLRKRQGYRVPVGRRLYDHAPIGSDIERRRAAPAAQG